METPALEVRSGAAIAQRLFDVAYAIDLARVAALWSDSTGTVSTRSRLATTPPKAVAFGVPPIELDLGHIELEVGGRSIDAAVSARLYDFGVAALSISVPIADMPWPDFVAFVNNVDRAVGPNATTNMWNASLQKLRASLAPAFNRPSVSTLEEDYLLALVTSFAAPLNAAELHQRVDLVPLLSGETRPLGEASQRELLRQQFSYYTDDAVVLTWDRAFIYEPTGDSDVADVLEVANAQLLELRYYDEVLDNELPRMYELVAQTRRARNVLAPRRLADLARKLYTLVAEVTELTEKVDNALQVTEDVYLARIYTAALELFRVSNVGAAVDRKLAIIRDTYAALYDEASASRAGLLELTIIALIVVEIVLAVVRP